MKTLLLCTAALGLFQGVTSERPFPSPLPAALATLSDLGEWAEIEPSGDLTVVLNAVSQNVTMETLGLDERSLALSFGSSESLAYGDGCCDCTKSAAVEVEKFVEDKLKEACKDSDKKKCPVIKAMCEWYEKKPKMVQGFLFGAVRAGEAGFSYCVGRKECKWEDASEVCEKQAGDVTSLDDLFPHINKDIDPLFFDEDAINYFLPDDDNDASKPICDNCDANADLTLEKKGCQCMCRDCIRRLSAFGAMLAVKQVEYYCKKTQDERAKKACEWAKNNKEQAFGFIIAKSEPWKAATGFCYGCGRCLPGLHPHRRTTTQNPGNAYVEDEEDFYAESE